MEVNKLFTITFSESVENHVGMQQIGVKLDKGFTLKRLKNIRTKFEEEGVKCKLVRLNKYNVDIR